MAIIDKQSQRSALGIKRYFNETTIGMEFTITPQSDGGSVSIANDTKDGRWVVKVEQMTPAGEINVSVKLIKTGYDW